MPNPVPPIAVNGQYPFLTPVSYANGGSAGGTFYYLQLGTVKMLWGTTAAITIAANASTTNVLNLPSGFFADINSMTLTTTTTTLQANQYVNTSSTLPATGTPTTLNIVAINTTGTASVTQKVSVFLVGD